jgi:type I restriction enzyme M protein
MTEEQKRKLEVALWGIANDLRGKMDADEFRDYILGFIFFKYLSERLHLYANDILREDGIEFKAIAEGTPEGEEIIDAIRAKLSRNLAIFFVPLSCLEPLLSAARKRATTSFSAT